MFVILSILAVVLVLLYIYGTSNFDYWAKRGVKYDKPVPYFGSVKDVLLQRISAADYYASIYNKFPSERYAGVFIAGRPALVVRDPDLIKRIMSTDFYNFYSRGFLMNKTGIEPVMRNLFFADGDLWRLLRQKMTPAFTTSKLKAMFHLIVERAESLQGLASDAARSGTDVDVRDLMARYTTDFIGTIGFGVEGNALNDENSKFRQVGKRIFTITKTDMIRLMLKHVFPTLSKNLHFFTPMVEDNIMSIMKSVMKERNYKPSGRNDFIDQLMDLKQKGKITIESMEKKNADGTPSTAELELDNFIMVGQLFLFFVAGFETSSSSTSFTLHQLAYHPEAQRRCQEEIDEVLARYNNKLCYEAVAEMTYLDMCFRRHAYFPFFGLPKKKMCDADYKVPDSDLVIEKDVDIIIPVQGLQLDEKHFKEPEKFIPERFHPDNMTFHKYVYLPFGLGPRACIGERLGHMQSLAGLAALLSQFSVAPGKSSLRHPISDPTAKVTQSIKDGLPLKAAITPFRQKTEK